MVAILALAVAAFAVRSCETGRQHSGKVVPAGERAATQRPTADAGIGAKPRAVGTLRLEGQVIDDREASVTGATVRITDGDFSAETVSNADGTFVFEHLIAAAYTVSALEEDRFSAATELALSAMTEPVVLELINGHSVTVEVRDAVTHAPIEGAKVVTYAHSGSQSAAWRKHVTGTDGRVVIRGLGFGWQLRTWASRDGYERREVSKLLELDPAIADELVIDLRHGAPVSGIVIDTNKQPVAGRPVSVDGHDSSDSVDSAADGHWRFDAVAAGPHVLTFSDGNHIVERFFNADGAHALEGIQLVVDTEEPVESLAGLVVDEAGHPVEGVYIYARMFKPLRFDQATTDGSGRFTVKLPLARGFQLSASKDELIAEMTISETERHAPMRIVVHPSLIEGDAYDRRGKRVPNAQILVSRRVDAKADSRGHFVVRGQHGDALELAAVAAERRLGGSSYDTTTVKIGDKHVRLIVDDVSSVIGGVELEGKPLTSYTLSLSDGSQFEFADFADEIVHAADGHFAMHGLPAGNLKITIKGVGFPPKELAPIRVVAGRDLDLGTISLDHGQVIRGRVLEPNGVPVSGATVTAHRQGPYSYMSVADLAAEGTVATKSDAAGNFVLSGFAIEGSTRIVAEHATKGSSGERPIDDRTTAIDLVLRPSGAIEGTIDGFDYMVNVSRVDDRAFSAVCEVDRLRRFSCENLEPGTYVVYLDYRPSIPKRVLVRAGERAHVDIQISPVRVDALLDFAAPCTTMTLETADDLHDLVRSGKCAYGGFSSIAPGSYRVCLDGARCTPITLAAAPEEQHFRVP